MSKHLFLTHIKTTEEAGMKPHLKSFLMLLKEIKFMICVCPSSRDNVGDLQIYGAFAYMHETEEVYIQ